MLVQIEATGVDVEIIDIDARPDLAAKYGFAKPQNLSVQWFRFANDTGDKSLISGARSLAIPDAEIVERFVRASGAGGQNVNKVSSAVHLRFDIRASSLREDVKERLLALRDSRITDEGVLILKAQRFRTQEQNRQDALLRLSEIVNSVARPPKTRRATRIFPVTKALLKELEAACPEVPATAISMGVDLDSFPFISRPRRDPGAPLRIATIARLATFKPLGHAANLALARTGSRDEHAPNCRDRWVRSHDTGATQNMVLAFCDCVGTI